MLLNRQMNSMFHVMAAQHTFTHTHIPASFRGFRIFVCVLLPNVKTFSHTQEDSIGINLFIVLGPHLFPKPKEAHFS